MTDSRAWGHGDSGVLHRRDPAAEQPEVDRHLERQGVRERRSATRGRTRGTSTSTTRCSTTTARASFRTRSTRSCSSRTRTGRSATTTSSGTTSTTSCRTRRCTRSPAASASSAADDQLPDRQSAWSCSDADGWEVKQQPDLRQLLLGRRGFSDPFNPAALNENNRPRTTRWVEDGSDTNQFDFYNDGSGNGATASRATPRLRSTCRPPPSTEGESCIRPARRQQPGTGTGEARRGHHAGPGRSGSRLRAERPALQAAGLLGPAHAPGFQGDHPDRHEDFGACK